MTITELLWPVFKPDPQTQAEFAAKAPEIFSHFVGIPGLRHFFRGRALFDKGEPVDEGSGRGALILGSLTHLFFYYLICCFICCLMANKRIKRMG